MKGSEGKALDTQENFFQLKLHKNLYHLPYHHASDTQP